MVIADDLIDSKESNYENQCWYKNDEVGVKALNDSVLVENGLYTLLKKHFSDLPSYVPTLELFHDATLKAAMGQTLDFFAKKDGKPDLSAFTMSRYNATVKYRSSYYSFYLPVALSMYLSKIFDPELHRQARTILLEMGHFHQVQVSLDETPNLLKRLNFSLFSPSGRFPELLWRSSFDWERRY